MTELDAAREIDRICQAYERAWQLDGGDVQIEHFASQASPAIRPQVLARMGEMDAQYREEQLLDVSTFDIDALLADELAGMGETDRHVSPAAARGQLRHVLLGCPTFAALAAEALDDLQSHLHAVRFAPDQTLIQSGQRAGGLLLLTEGEIDVVTITAMAPRTLDRCGPGSVVGEMSLLTGASCTATVRARSAVEALRLSVDDYHQLCTRHPEIEMALSQLVSDRLGGRKVDALYGKVLGKFRVLECIGRGGMGVVYRARPETSLAESLHGQASSAATTGAAATAEASPGRGELALKMLRHRFIYDADAVEHFYREGELLAGIHHPNLVNIEASFLAFRTRFLVMERCTGCDLAQVLARCGPLSERQVLALFGQLAVGLSYLHHHQILHLDLKPANLILDHGGTLKIADFGLSRLLEEPPASVLRGTPAYMAPEQLTGEAVDGRADWYAAACVVYELVTGSRRFRARDLMETALRKTTFDPQQSWPHWPASTALAEVLRAALEPNPEKRVLNLDQIAQWAAPVVLD